MARTNDFQPNWASAPGRTIGAILMARQLPLDVFAAEMNQSNDSIDALLSGHAPITQAIANQLEKVLGTSYSFWVNRELQYRETLARLKNEAEIQWIKEIPYGEMIKFGWLKESKNKLASLLNFFNVPDIETWKIKYSTADELAAFRTSPTYKSSLGSVSTWLRQGEIKAEAIPCKKWNKEMFADALPEIKKLTREKDPQDFVPKLIKICSEYGVAVVIVPTPNGCRASGATRFISEDKAIIQLSFRYLSDDHFWFTFFHEAGHLILHGKNSLFLEGAQAQQNGEKEAEANTFAGEALIPYTLENDLKKIRGNKRRIIQFAQMANVSPGIVIGQLQHRGYIDRGYLNSYKRRYNWGDIVELSNL